MSDFYVGQKVVWVGGANYSPDVVRGIRSDVGDRLSKDPIYEISWIGMHHFLEGHVPALRLKNMMRISQGSDLRDIIRDGPWAQMYFRPVQSKAISLFRKIARDVTEGRKVEFVE